MSDMQHVLAECDRPSVDTDDQQRKGFWRVDKDKDPELRQTVLTLVAFHDLQAKIATADGDREQGVEDFLTQNDGEGWLLPERLCLSGHGLGHDDRSNHPKPVATRLGLRFRDWQLVQSVEESWRECHLHAHNVLGARDYSALRSEIDSRDAPETDSSLQRVAEHGADYSSNPLSNPGQGDLFEKANA